MNQTAENIVYPRYTVTCYGVPNAEELVLL